MAKMFRVEKNNVFVFEAKVEQMGTWKESEVFFVANGNRFSGVEA